MYKVYNKVTIQNVQKVIGQGEGVFSREGGIPYPSHKPDKQKDELWI